MGVEVIPDPCSGGCCGTPGCVGCQCSPFVVPPNVKITIATLIEFVDGATFPPTRTNTTFTTTFTPLPTDAIAPCTGGILPAALMTYHVGGTYNIDTSLEIFSPGLRLCNISTSDFLGVFIYKITHEYRAGSPRTFTVNGTGPPSSDGFGGGATTSTSCNPDGTWVISVTIIWLIDYTFSLNYQIVATNTITIECIP